MRELGGIILLVLSAAAPAVQDGPKRAPWTSSRIVGTPDPPPPYRLVRAFPGLEGFSGPVELAGGAGLDRLFVVERKGRIYSFLPRSDVSSIDPCLDLRRTCYGLAIHPDFQKNGFLYVTSIVSSAGPGRRTRVSRFRMRPERPWEADPARETVILEWPSGGHNGGCLQFGLDGMLYIATGDGSPGADALQTGQDVGDLLGSILRIDVDRPEGGLAYGIPADNPFVDLPGARPEVWAYGLRQPWKFSFDRGSGELWCGEVGQDLWEMVYRIERGGNYGWSVTEGAHPFRPDRRRGPGPILPPVIDHPHSEARSLTGGYVYRGKRFPELVGVYVYGDYDTGRVWGVRHDGARVTYAAELADSTLRIVDFAEDRDGELYALDHAGGDVYRLERTPPERFVDTFPRMLSQTGLFASTRDLRPAPGVIPYSVNAPLWSDGALKERLLAVPGDGRIGFDAVPALIHGGSPGWDFPDGTVLVKTFSLEGVRLETRILHLRKMPGARTGEPYWRGYTYVWNGEQTDADLLGAAGADKVFVRDGRPQSWRFPSRSECTSCHTRGAKYVLGVNTLQMNRDHDDDGRAVNQLRLLERLGFFTEPLPSPPDRLPRLVDFADAGKDLNLRARSYLHANCSHCHMKWGGGNADFHLVAPLGLKELGIVDGKPVHDSFRIPDARLLAPGHPERSLIHHRMTRLDGGRMPRIGSLRVDPEGTKLIHDWILRMNEPRGTEKEDSR